MSGTRLPNAANANVPADKVCDYLLEPAHKDNAGKAEFFFRFGFTLANWSELQSALAAHPLINPVTRIPGAASPGASGPSP